MARQLFKQPRSFRVALCRVKPSGFTLIEVLVALLVGSLITTGLLFLVVQLLQTNQREAARSDTQRDVQAALDYIARDLREAVYVYDGDCLDRPANYNPRESCPGLKNFLPPEIAGTAANSNNLPVLAFWRIDQLPKPVMDVCVRNAGGYSARELPAAIRGVPCLSQRMYTLVVYSLNWQPRNGMRGRARIMRYQLPQFSYSAGDTISGVPEVTRGWVSPTEPTMQNGQQRETDFFFWPVDKGTLSTGNPEDLQAELPVSRNEVLVDYIDQQGIYNNGQAAGAACPTGTTDPNNPSAPREYLLTPRDGGAANNPLRGFYVCVKGSVSGGALNQEVIVRIVGEAANRPGIPDRDPTKPIVPIPMETRVLTRGVVNKTQ